jgi:aspartate/methionine/tyrosine aminotransferase
MPGIAEGVAQLDTEAAFAVLARARELERAGLDVVHLEIGQPDFDTPAHVIEAAASAMRRGETGYCPTEGLPELREAAATYLGASRGLEIEPRRVLVGTGAKPFLFFTILACVNPGDEVVYPDPGFPIYRSAIAWAGGVPVPLALREQRGFSFDPDELAALISPRTRLVILNSPNNPTGAVIPASDLRALATLLERTDAWILSDEVYTKIVYDQPAQSVASLPGMLERTVLLDGCSKTFAMTGWRCGFAAVPEQLIEPLTLLFVNSTSCVPPFVQRGAIAALTGTMASVEEMVAEFRRRRGLVVDGLNALPGVRCAAPAGAFYAFPNIAETGFTGDELAPRLLDETGVAVVTGSSFGAQGAAHIRLSYAASQPQLSEGLRRLAEFLARSSPEIRAATARS